jgi:hypothetical protein
MVENKLGDDSKSIDHPTEWVTEAEYLGVLNELIQREPIFHHPEFGTTPQDFENMMDAEFWEVGASGRCYSREFVLAEVMKRYEDPKNRGIYASPENTWETKDFRCRKIAHNNYLLTYTLFQGERMTRRSTLWRRSSTGWKILYHQGTIVQDE